MSIAKQLYDTIGVGYDVYRRPDARIARRLHAALGAARSVVNVGAGSGSYEPAERRLLAVEPSLEMIQQRRAGAAPVVRASALALPLASDSFDAALAILTLHHWGDWRRGLGELRRVARGPVVVLTWDPDGAGFWLVQDYLPSFLELDRANFPPVAEYAEVLGRTEVHSLPVPHDCTDGFLGAYWRRPEKYLDPGARRAISSFAYEPDCEPGIERLRADLASGAWERKHGAVLAETELDLGYRLVIGLPDTPGP